MDATRCTPRGPDRALCGTCDRRDAPCEDARPAGTTAARGRPRCSAARHRGLDRRGGMSGGLLWILVAIGLAVVVVKRRSVAVALVTAQALVLVGFALYDAKDAGDVVAAGALASRAVALAALFLLLVSRTREVGPVHARGPPLVPAGAAAAFALTLTLLVPALGLHP